MYSIVYVHAAFTESTLNTRRLSPLCADSLGIAAELFRTPRMIIDHGIYYAHFITTNVRDRYSRLRLFLPEPDEAVVEQVCSRR